MKLKELFKAERISDEFITEEFDGSYWESCGSFVTENWDRDMETLSPKQASWVTKILDDCVEKRIEGQGSL